MTDNTFIKTLKIINVNNWKLLLIVIAFVAVSIIDVIGIALVGPYIALISNSAFLENELIQKFTLIFNIPLNFQILFIVISISLLLVFLLKFFASIYIQWSISKFSYTQLKSLRVNLMKSYQSSDYDKYLDVDSSTYVYTVDQITSLFIGYLIACMKLLSDLVISLAIIFLLAWVDIYLLISLVLMMSVALFIYDRLIKIRITNYGKECNSASITMMRGVKEGLDGLKEIRILGKENYFFNLVKDNAKAYSSNQTKLSVLKVIPRYFIEFLMVFFIIFTSMVYVYIGQDLNTIFPTLGVFGVSAIRLVPAFNSLSNGMVVIRSTKDTISRLYDELIRFQNSNTEVIPISQEKMSSFSEITIKNVHYHYPSTPNIPILNGVDLNIKQGECIGITGTSGSGKTTLIDLLLGLLRPSNGSILYNDIPLEKLMKGWRSKVSYLPQKAFLIDGSIKENIALGEINQSIDNEKLSRSLKFAQLSQLIKELPSGIDTLIGEGGVKISGGQRQRVALARAFYHDREVLVMDETTSALDESTQKEIMREIERLSGNITIIIITHSKALLSLCNSVYNLDKGRIIEITSNSKKVS